MNTKDIILEKTLLLILEKRSVDISMKDINEATGIAIGGIYYHFKSKDDLFDEIINRYLVDYFKIDFNPLDLNSKTTKEKIHDLMLSVLKKRQKGIKIEVANSEIDYRYVVSLLLSLGYKNENLPKVWTQSAFGLMEYIEQLVKEAQDNNEITLEYSSEDITNALTLPVLGIYSLWESYSIEKMDPFFEKYFEMEWNHFTIKE